MLRQEQPLLTESPVNSSIFWTYGFPALCALFGAAIASLFSRTTNRESNQTNFLAQAVEAWQTIAEAAKSDYDDLKTKMDQIRAELEDERRVCNERITDLTLKIEKIRREGQ